MIVETDFLTHWKTNSLIDALDDPAAPCYLLHLWAHCQTRKEYRFDSDKLTPKILKRITRSPADAQIRERAEEKEEAEKQDEGEKGDEPSISPPPGNKPFWYGTDYSTAKHRTVEGYHDIHAIRILW